MRLTKVQRRRAAFENARERLYDLIVAAEEAGDHEITAGATEALNKLAEARALFEADQRRAAVGAAARKGSSRS